MDTQNLFDALAGATGHAINRPGIDLGIATAQARNGLVSEQTELAMQKAQEAQDQQTARGKLRETLGALMGPDDSAKADAATNFMLSGFGDAKTAISALGELQQNNFRSTIGDASKLGTAEQTAAQQGIQGKVAEPVAVPQEFVTLPGMPTPNVQQTPMGAASTAEKNASADLHKVQTAAGGFNPHSSSTAPADPNAVAFGAYMLYKTGRMPALGMGAGAARSAILAGAAQLGQQEAEGQDISNPGFDTAIENGQDFTAAGRALGGFAGGPLGNQTRAINNLVGHLKLYDTMVGALENGDVRLINAASAAWQKAFGSPAPTDLQAAGSIIGPELAKVMTNSTAGTGEERQNFLQTAGSLANAPQQTHSAINTLRSMMGRQAADLALQYHGATGRGDFAGRYLQPDVSAYLDLDPHTAQTPGAGPPAAGPPAAQIPPQALAQLSEGHITTFGNGQKWTLHGGQPTQVQ